MAMQIKLNDELGYQMMEIANERGVTLNDLLNSFLRMGLTAHIIESSRDKVLMIRHGNTEIADNETKVVLSLRSEP